MRLAERNGVLVVQDSPGLHWALGFLFATVCAAFVLGPVWLFTSRASVSWQARALSMLMGGVGVAAGVWVLTRAPRSTLEIDRRADRVRIRRRGFGGVEVRAWPIREVAGARLAESRDDEGGAVFRVEVVLASSDVVPISRLWTHGREPAEAVVRRLQEVLAIPPPSGSR
jgi:hypothetical protein